MPGGFIKKEHRREIELAASPSDDAALQVVELDELPEATGVVILRSPGVAKSLFEI